MDQHEQETYAPLARHTTAWADEGDRLLFGTAAGYDVVGWELELLEGESGGGGSCRRRACSG